MSEPTTDYKKKYRTLKKRLKFLIYEQECFAEELKKSQRKLLKLNREKSFLLDQLMQYEQPNHETSDSDETQSSASEQESAKKIVKKKKICSNISSKPLLNAIPKSSLKSKKLNISSW
ncbi:hypothetical protein HELRODRAFT_162149 [Helobdella robusta]|uniref:INO80 complex subunit E N-terminal domain-containing protein n=1 Tax=Helobdella robusta TaxID=6412 RepID=T1ESA3_HELRO|nr:hypothetical protein HELRODRAFT_162149 [Helobdella robusta]ESN98695.1 hypothetical protein HELRODRAFT_162149 [Helobdella robusta]